jgi:hypothetical protein
VGDPYRVVAEPPRGRVRLGLALALLLLAVYAVPLLMPPAGGPVAPLAPDASLLERLFPGVPTGWVLLRLLCLAAGMVVLLCLVRDSPFVGPVADAARTLALPDDTVSPRRMRMAVCSAALQVTAGVAAAHFDRAVQLLYVAWLGVPPLLLTSWRRWRAKPWFRNWRAVLTVGGIVAVWLVLRVPAEWRSARAADATDTWIGVRFLADAADSRFNLLTGRFLPGSGSLHFLFQGAAVASVAGIEPSFALAQAAQFVWLAVSGMAVGLLTARLLGGGAAAVATAAFLFSPFTLMTLVAPLPFFFYPLVCVFLMVLFVKVHDERSLPALVALGGLAGIGATLHSANLVSVLVLGAAVWSALHAPRMRTAGVVIAILLFAAGALTTLSDIESIRGILAHYSTGRAQWVAHEMAAFGQISQTASEYAVEAAIVRPFDTPLSALLAPFALPRTPLRLLGDTLFDPVGGALSAIGVAVGVRAWRASWLARLLLGLLALSVLPAFVSTQDRISVIRLLVTPVPMALFAGVGWESVRRWFMPSVRPGVAAALVTVAVAAGGMFVFDRVNPRILASSWVSLTLSALDDMPPPGGAVLVDHPNPQTFPYGYLNEIVRGLAPPALAVRAYDEAGTFWTIPGSDQPAAELFFWNPGLEEDRHVAHAVCQRWPRTALYTLFDRAGRSRVFAARPQGPGWRPALSDTDWREQGCDSVLQTEATWAAGVVQQAHAWLAQGRRQDAVVLLRAAARRNFAQAGLFQATAEALVGDGAADRPRRAREAVHWARRACQVTHSRDAGMLATLAATYAAAGRWSEAVDAARQAGEVASAQGDAAAATRMAALQQEYERFVPAGSGPEGRSERAN